MRARPESRVYGPNGEVRFWLEQEPELLEWQREYKAECDRLAEEAAKRIRGRGKRHWGRWFLNMTYFPPSLDTKVWFPAMDGCPARCVETYDIALSTCRTEAQRDNWLRHMREKRWLGEQGLADLSRAFVDLVNEGIIGELQEETPNLASTDYTS